MKKKKIVYEIYMLWAIYVLVKKTTEQVPCAFSVCYRYISWYRSMVAKKWDILILLQRPLGFVLIVRNYKSQQQQKEKLAVARL